MAIVIATRDGRAERIGFTTFTDQCKLRVDNQWHVVSNRGEIIALLEHAGYTDIHAPEIITLQ